MASSSNQLIEIPRSEWLNLRDLYKIDWPKHHVAFNTIQNFYSWFEKNPNIDDIKTYSLNGDWTDGTFIIVDRFYVFFSTLGDDVNRLVTALNLLDKSKIFLLYGFVERLLPAARKLFEINNWPFDLTGGEVSWNYLEKDMVKKFVVNPPPGVIIKPLTEENAKMVDDLWPHNYPGSIVFIKRLIRYNISLGAFKKDSDELMAWCLRIPLGSLGTLHVRDEYQRQGLGSLLVKAMSKKFIEMDEDITAPVIIENFPSKSMFDKLGFKKVGYIYLIQTIATTDPNANRKFY